MVRPRGRPRERTDGVHGKLIVLHVLAKDVGDAGRPSLALEFGMIRRVAYAFSELNPC